MHPSELAGSARLGAVGQAIKGDFPLPDRGACTGAPNQGPGSPVKEILSFVFLPTASLGHYFCSRPCSGSGVGSALCPLWRTRRSGGTSSRTGAGSEGPAAATSACFSLRGDRFHLDSKPLILSWARPSPSRVHCDFCIFGSPHGRCGRLFGSGFWCSLLVAGPRSCDGSCFLCSFALIGVIGTTVFEGLILCFCFGGDAVGGCWHSCLLLSRNTCYAARRCDCRTQTHILYPAHGG